MTIETITMDRDAARTAYRDYQAAVRADRAGVRSHWRKEDAALARGYHALAKGQSLLNVQTAMQTAGLRDDGFPKLAMCRADLTRVEVRMGWSGDAVFRPHEGTGRWGRPSKAERLEFPNHTFPVLKSTMFGERRSTIVPIIPPALRPKTALAKFHLLWEVNEWRLVPPVDPILLKHLGGDLYTVLAVWDLTPLERAVLGARAVEP